MIYEETILTNIQRIRDVTTYKAICNTIGSLVRDSRIPNLIKT